MKFSVLAIATIAAFGAALTAATAQSNSDDAKWVAQCIRDNKDEGQTVQVVTSYCTCMNDKMDSNETRSITQWEKANKREMEACSAQAGWKGR